MGGLGERFEAVVARCGQAMLAGRSEADVVADARPQLAEVAAAVRQAGVRWPGCEERYARHLLARCPETEVSLFAVVWAPGQRSPVHDHGVWGAVTVVEGGLIERRFVQETPERVSAAGEAALAVGEIAGFTSEPEHVHEMSAPEGALSLHLYGGAVREYHVYDPELGLRQRVVAEG